MIDNREKLDGMSAVSIVTNSMKAGACSSIERRAW
jgi:hypothetical protein